MSSFKFCKLNSKRCQWNYSEKAWMLKFKHCQAGALIAWIASRMSGMNSLHIHWVVFKGGMAFRPFSSASICSWVKDVRFLCNFLFNWSRICVSSESSPLELMEFVFSPAPSCCWQPSATEQHNPDVRHEAGHHWASSMCSKMTYGESAHEQLDAWVIWINTECNK